MSDDYQREEFGYAVWPTPPPPPLRPLKITLPEGVPAWPDYFLNLARVVATRSKCTRRKVGAVIADADHTIVESGYNGSPPGWPECAEDCPRGKHYDKGRFCACGLALPCPYAVEPGSSYDTGPGACRYTHAEANALLRAGRRSRDAFLYVTDEPCGGCRKLIASAGIVFVQWPEGWWHVTPDGQSGSGVAQEILD